MGKTISQSALLGRQGQWPMYVSLYGDRGALVGWVTFANEAGKRFVRRGSMDQAPPGGGTALLRWFHEPVCGGWVRVMSRRPPVVGA